jgi:hypothetical protein
VYAAGRLTPYVALTPSLAREVVIASASMSFEIDDRSWPIVKARWSGTSSDRDVDAALSRIDEYLRRDGRFGLLIDSRGGGGFSPEQRNRVLAHMKARAQLTSRLLVQAVVIDNLLQRTLYYGVRLLLPSPFPSKVFAQPDAAEAWLRLELVAAVDGPAPEGGPSPRRDER